MGRKLKGSNLVGAKNFVQRVTERKFPKEKLFSSPEFIFVGAKSRSFVRRRKTEEKKGAAINLVVRGDGTQPKKINKNKKDATTRDKSWAGHETRTDRSVEGQPIDSHKELGK